MFLSVTGSGLCFQVLAMFVVLMVSDVLPVDMSVVRSYHSKLLVIGVVLSYKWWVLLL